MRMLRNYTRRMTVRRSVLTVFFLPLLVALALGSHNSMSAYQEYQDTHASEEVIDFAIIVNAVVHELQLEGGLSAAAMTNGDETLHLELVQQRTLTDEFWEDLSDPQYYVDLDVFPDIAARRAEIEQKRSELLELRNFVDGKSSRSFDVIKDYARLEGALIDFMAFITHQDNESPLFIEMRELELLARLKQAASYEQRASVRALSQERFSPKLFQDFLKSVEHQNIFTGQLRNIAAGPFKDRFEAFLSSDESRIVEEKRQMAFDHPQSGKYKAVSPEGYFDAQSVRIALLREIEQDIMHDIHEEMEVAEAEAAASFYIMLGGSMGFLLFATLIAYIVIHSMRMYLAETVSVANRLSEGDLDGDMPKVLPNEIGQIVHALEVFRTAVLQNSQLAREVKIREEAKQASRVRNLKSSLDRAEKVSGELQKTSESLGELSQAVNTAAENAAEARSHAGIISSRAEKGHDIVEETVAAMKLIKSSTTEIATVTQIIDEIAFQTNLLALNARVEAARAGAAGRGFAVVAAEVQNLAGRSASAAQNIEDLIRKSSEQVEHGVEIVEQSGEELVQISKGIMGVSERIGLIADTSKEQAAKIAEISEATENLDLSMQRIISSSDDQHIHFAPEAENMAAQ